MIYHPIDLLPAESVLPEGYECIIIARISRDAQPEIHFLPVLENCFRLFYEEWTKRYFLSVDVYFSMFDIVWRRHTGLSMNNEGFTQLHYLNRERTHSLLCTVCGDPSLFEESLCPDCQTITNLSQRQRTTMVQAHFTLHHCCVCQKQLTSSYQIHALCCGSSECTKVLLKDPVQLPKNMGNIHDHLVFFLVDHGPCTPGSIQYWCQYDMKTICTGLDNLIRQGVVETCGVETEKPAYIGQTIYRLKEKEVKDEL